MKKKLIFYIDSLGIGGAERVFSNLANGMAKKGHKVTVINDYGTESMEYPLSSNIRRYFLGDRRQGFIGRTVSRVLELQQIIRTERPDIVISFKKGPNYRLIMAKIITGCKIIVSVRSASIKEYGSGVKRIMALFLFRFADGIVFQTEEQAAYFTETERKKSAIIYNPIRRDFFDTTWRDNENRIICVGRLERVKRPFLLLEAFKNIKDEFPNSELVFLGDGSLKDFMVSYCVKHYLADRVFFWGRVENVPAELAKSGVYVLCSEWEGLPNALMEAMAVGVPVIATDCIGGGPKSLIRNGKEGMLIKSHNADDLAYALRVLLSDASKRNEMSIAERKRAQDFREEVILEKWETYMQKIIQSK